MKLELSDQAIEPLEERESIEQRVAQSLRALIVAGQLPEGTQLVQRELAARLGVSQTPVRASLSRLEREGFVAVGSTGRAFVSRLTREDFEEIYAARLGLEGLAARLGAEAVGAEELAGMRKTLDRLERAATKQDIDAYLALRWEFYGTCYRASGRRRLVEEVERLYWRSERYNRIVLSTAQRFQESLGRYAGLLRELRGERRARGRARRPRQPALGGRQRRGRASVRGGVQVVSVAVQELRDALVEALGEGDARVSDGDSERDLHAEDITFHKPRRPDLVVYPSSTEDVSRVLAIASERRVAVTPFGAGSSLEGHVIPSPGRHQPRSLADEPDRRDRRRGSQRDRAGGRDANAARARGGRARALLPGRSRRRRDARRHGRDERGRDDDDPLREDARQRARARGRAPRRDGRPDRQPSAKDVRRLRPDEPARRVGGDARGDHRGARPPVRDPGAHRRAAHLLPVGRGGLPDGRRGRRGRLGRVTARAARRLDARGDQRLPRLGLPRGPVPARRGCGHRGHGRGRPGARARAGRGGGGDRGRRRARPDRQGQAVGGPARRGLRDGRSLAGAARARHGHLRPRLRAGRRGRVRPRRGGAPRLQGVHPRPCR